jgi:dynein heavy chain
MQGARWEPNAGSVDKSKPKEMFCPMPTIIVRGVSADKVSESIIQRNRIR